MFLLYQKKDKIFPENVSIGGDLYSVNADFKNILRILDMLDDENISEYKKIHKLREWFFDDGLPDNMSRETIIDVFIDFLRETTPSNGAPRASRPTPDEMDRIEKTEERERQFCYHFDAGEIYAGFLSEYHIDLIDVDMHWYKFRILLENLSPESAFKRKIELRIMDLSGHDSLDGGRKFAELARAKESVQLPTRVTKTIENLQEEFNEIWGKAGN